MKKHQWVAIATIPLNDGDAAQAMAKGFIGRPIEEKDVKDIQIGCIDCDNEIRAVFGKPCLSPKYTYEDTDVQ